MKKFILMLTMLMLLAFSAVCSASNGKVLDAEEAIVTKFLNAKDYKAVTSMMTADMQKDFTAETFGNFKVQLAKNFGEMKTNKLFMVEKGEGVDVLRYVSSFAKQPEAQFIFMFVLNGEKPLLQKFALMLPPAPKAEAAPAKK